MKQIKYLAYFAILVFGLSSCLKDQDLTKPDQADDSDSKVMINEILSTGDPDWAEFYNPTSEDIDISGFEVSDGPEAKYTLPSGSIIPANGYYVFLADKTEVGFGLSSSGEEFYIWDTEGNLVDNIEFSALDDGVSYGRSSDGADTWQTMSPSQGAANSNENTPPVLDADTILSMSDNQGYEYIIKAVDASGFRDIKIFFENKTTTMVKFEEMAPIGDGEYKYNFPVFNADDEIEYYIVATDETGKTTYFPESAPGDKLTVTVEDGAPTFSNFTQTPAVATESVEIVLSIDVYDKGGIDIAGGDVSLYYTINSENPDDAEKTDMVSIDGVTYIDTIPTQEAGTIIRYYIRAKDIEGNKGYYPTENDDFDHDDITSWPQIEVLSLNYVDGLVINEIHGSGEPEDYIELYNNSGADMDISGYKLQDDDPTEAYTIPAGTIIPNGGFYIKECTGDYDPDTDPDETQFKVSSGGEDISLLDASNNIVDQLLEDDWPEYVIGGLVGRAKDAAELWIGLTEATPGASNN